MFRVTSMGQFPPFADLTMEPCPPPGWRGAASVGKVGADVVGRENLRWVHVLVAALAAALRVLRKIRHVCPGRLSTVVVWDSWWWMRTGSRGCWRRCARI